MLLTSLLSIIILSSLIISSGCPLLLPPQPPSTPPPQPSSRDILFDGLHNHRPRPIQTSISGTTSRLFTLLQTILILEAWQARLVTTATPTSPTPTDPQNGWKSNSPALASQSSWYVTSPPLFCSLRRGSGSVVGGCLGTLPSSERTLPVCLID